MYRGVRNPKLFGSSYSAPKRAGNQPHLDRFWRAVIILIMLVVAGWLFVRLPYWQIKTVELIGDKDTLIAGEVNGLVSQSIFSTSISRLNKKIRTNLGVSSFDCSRGLPATLRCKLALRKAAMSWKSGDVLYSIDDRGIIFSTLPASQADLLLVEDTQNLPTSLGMVVASPEILNHYRQLVELLGAKGLVVKTLLLKESLYQVTAVIERSGKAPIQGLFLLSSDVKNQVETLATTLATAGESVTERIDVRVPGYVYTK